MALRKQRFMQSSTQHMKVTKKTFPCESGFPYVETQHTTSVKGRRLQCVLVLCDTMSKQIWFRLNQSNSSFETLIRSCLCRYYAACRKENLSVSSPCLSPADAVSVTQLACRLKELFVSLETCENGSEVKNLHFLQTVFFFWEWEFQA